MSRASSYCSRRCSVIEAEGDQNIPVKRCRNNKKTQDYHPTHTHSYNTRLSAKFARPQRSFSCDSAIFEDFISDSVELVNAGSSEMSLRGGMHMGTPCSDPCSAPNSLICKLCMVAIATLVFAMAVSHLNGKFHFTGEDQVLKRELRGIQNQIGQMKEHVHFVVKAKEDTTKMISELNKMVNEIKNLGPNERNENGNIDPAIQDALDKYSADKIGRPDYALESAGASIISTRHTEDFNKGSSISLFGWTLCFHGRGARAIIQPTVMPGECWAFRGSKGSVVIKLLSPIYITGITLEHIPKEIAPSKDIKSAPKEFAVIGLATAEDMHGESLGRFTYNIDMPPIQYFAIKKTSAQFVYVEVKFESNYGNLDYTCIYRIRIHGSENLKD